MQAIEVRPMRLAEKYEGSVSDRCQLNCDHFYYDVASHRVTYRRTDGVKLIFSACRRCADQERESLKGGAQ